MAISVKRQRNERGVCKSLEKDLICPLFAQIDVICSDLVTDDDAGGLLDPHANSVTQCGNLHRNHHVGLHFHTEVSRDNGKELPGPVLSTQDASSGDT